MILRLQKIIRIAVGIENLLSVENLKPIIVRQLKESLKLLANAMRQNQRVFENCNQA